MAFCDRRGIELKEGVENWPPPALPETDRKLLLTAIDTWDGVRQENLDKLCVALREQSGTNCAETWKRYVEGLQYGLRQFSEALRAMSSPLEGSLHFVQSNVAADEKFVSAIAAAAVVAQARDYMVRHVAMTREETRNLELKWDRLVSEHGSYQQQEGAVIEQVESLIREAIMQAQGLDTKIAKLIADSVSKARETLQAMPEGGADTVNIPNNNEIVVAGTVIDTFRALAAGIEDQRMRFERYMREESGSVRFLFQDFRSDTQKFIEKCGYKTVLEFEESAKKALSEIISAGGTSSGNKSDAETFAEAAGILIKGKVNDCKNTWDDFVQKHEKKFFGPVGPEFAKALLDRDFFESKTQKLQTENLNQLAEKWRNEAQNIWGVNFSGIPPHVVDTYRNALKDKLRDLDVVLRDPLLKRFEENLKVLIDNAAAMIK